MKETGAMSFYRTVAQYSHVIQPFVSSSRVCFVSFSTQ